MYNTLEAGCSASTVTYFYTDSVKVDISIHKHRIFAPPLTFYMALTVHSRHDRNQNKGKDLLSEKHLHLNG
jgi:hypothetical protein